MNNPASWKIPAGLRDWLPGEAAEKRALINKALNKMSLWGYEEISTPLLEYYPVLIKGESGPGPDHLYKLVDRDGSILALRTEMTIPIARVISSKIAGSPPWRLMYGAEAFRYEDVQAGRQREFTQAGVELIGQEGAEADSEILALAMSTLHEIGLQNFTVSLGHTGILQGLLEWLSLEEEELDRVRELILEKDFAGLHLFLESSGLPASITQRLLDLLTRPVLREELTQMGRDLPDTMGKALADLEKIVSRVEVYGLSSHLQIDLSTLRSQTYYTGMVFEIYTAGIGYPIGGGGRYDQLLRRFGPPYPATGFALGIERLLLGLNASGEKTTLYYLAGNGRSPERLLQKGQALRSKGERVIIELREMEQDKAREFARGIEAQLIWVTE